MFHILQGEVSNKVDVGVSKIKILWFYLLLTIFKRPQGALRVGLLH